VQKIIQGNGLLMDYDEYSLSVIEATSTTNGAMTKDEKTKLTGIDTGAQRSVVFSVSGKTGAVTLEKEDVGLGNVDNTSDLSKPLSTAVTSALTNKVVKVSGKGLSENDFTTTEKGKIDNIETGAQKNVVNSVAGRTGAVTITKADAGLGNVNNTKDSEKSVLKSGEAAVATKTKEKLIFTGDSTSVFDGSTVVPQIIVPAPYVLPIASATTIGGVKPDGTTIKINENGIISSESGGGGATPEDILSVNYINRFLTTSKIKSTLTFGNPQVQYYGGTGDLRTLNCKSIWGGQKLILNRDNNFFIPFFDGQGSSQTGFTYKHMAGTFYSTTGDNFAATSLDGGEGYISTSESYNYTYKINDGTYVMNIQTSPAGYNYMSPEFQLKYNVNRRSINLGLSLYQTYIIGSGYSYYYNKYYPLVSTYIAVTSDYITLSSTTSVSGMTNKFIFVDGNTKLVYYFEKTVYLSTNGSYFSKITVDTNLTNVFYIYYLDVFYVTKDSKLQSTSNFVNFTIVDERNIYVRASMKTNLALLYYSGIYYWKFKDSEFFPVNAATSKMSYLYNIQWMDYFNCYTTMTVTDTNYFFTLKV
jgi:hypothetical protein